MLKHVARTSCLLCVSLATVAGCASAPVPIRVISVGTYSAEVLDTSRAPKRTKHEQSMGLLENPVLLDSSTSIPLVPNTRFGVVYVLEGWSRKNYPSRVIWRYPPPGRLESTGERVLSNEWNGVITGEWVDAKGFYIGRNIDRWPEGKYTLEIFVGSDLVIHQSFDVKRPAIPEAIQ
jgi:hypothetical protein